MVSLMYLDICSIHLELQKFSFETLVLHKLLTYLTAHMVQHRLFWGSWSLANHVTNMNENKQYNKDNENNETKLN